MHAIAEETTMYTGTIGQYAWMEWREEHEELIIPHVLSWLKSLLSNMYAVNTSFDSGLYQPTEDERHIGWSMHGKHAVSAPLTGVILESFPDIDYTEWYFYREFPQEFPTGAFCNWCGLSVSDHAQVKFSHDFEADIHRCMPEMVLGEGRFLYLIYKPTYHQEILTRLPENVKKAGHV